MEKRLNDYLNDWDMFLTDAQEKQFQKYYELLTEKNKVMNLTAITEYEEVKLKHFVDSLSLIKAKRYLPASMEGLRLIDVGTGAGFPGIPLKIYYPELEVVLMDSLNKRIGFLNEVIQELGLHGITAVHSRAEELAHKVEFREQYNICTSRAVANLATLSEYCLPFLRIGGVFISYKSGNISEELDSSKKAIQILGGKIKGIQEFTLPGNEIARSLVVIEKVKHTGKKYPRTPGKPGKEPII
ncbi:16S rRNA (guanine(527)-N(7))-methyltransferase RsmG [Anaerolentibacter hominis]|uniref:16S rRNA (guanine(527)-N(7))-methyltransferase RsmG n=1 Tax=Anaerolentibacter hominis TaxID=3079009 RepID=UPI0031B887E5